jgi:hypothetical protein
MNNSPQQSHPALQFLKDNIVVIGLVVVVAASVAFFAFSQASVQAKSAAEVNPTSLATAALDNSSSSASPSASAAPAASASASGTTDTGAATAGAHNPTQPTATATSTAQIASANSKALTAQDWKPYAESFTKAWLNTSGGKEAWLGRLKPMVSAGLYAGFTKTDIATVPSATFQSVSLAEESKASKTFRAYASTGAILEGRVSIQVDGSWIVDQVGPPAK